MNIKLVNALSLKQAGSTLRYEDNKEEIKIKNNILYFGFTGYNKSTIKINIKLALTIYFCNVL